MSKNWWYNLKKWYVKINKILNILNNKNIK